MPNVYIERAGDGTYTVKENGKVVSGGHVPRKTLRMPPSVLRPVSILMLNGSGIRQRANLTSGAKSSKDSR